MLTVFPDVIADGFDIVVNDCYAHNGAQKKIQLIDQYGWVNNNIITTIDIIYHNNINAITIL